MTSLKELLVNDGFEQTVSDTAAFISATVNKQSGLTGVALKGALAAATKVDSDILTKGSRRLLPELADSLDGLWQEYSAGDGTDFGSYLSGNSDRALDAILGVADRNADSISVPGLAKVYRGVRGKAAKVIEEELPEIGALVQKHAA
ncbi:DUF6918 family protein [Corynebacterium pacaense]|uniref:DUF6918 family protein n=1 Tax=Corynebacterium pacaense TaxID=1816684 RepID=UPI0011773964|nr:hypothetical protein [Corynebacterium pacaense]